MRMFRGNERYCSISCAERSQPSDKLKGDSASLNKEEDAIGAGEAGRALGLSLGHIKTACELGKLRAWRKGTKWWVSRSEVERLVQDKQLYGKVEL